MEVLVFLYLFINKANTRSINKYQRSINWTIKQSNQIFRISTDDKA